VYSVRPAPKPPEEEKPAAQLPPPPPPPPQKSDSEIVFTSLVDKLGSLLTHVEKLLEKPPQQVIYQNHTTMAPAPVREANQRLRRPHPNMTGNSTLRDIFQTNLDLRQSLEKLANNGGNGGAPSAGPGNGAAGNGIGGGIGGKSLGDTAQSVADAANRLTQAVAEVKAAERVPAADSLPTTAPVKVEEEADAEHHTPTNGRETDGREPKEHGLATAQPAA
jgi:hypothetical protein